MSLKRSKDRKVTNMVNTAGKAPLIANTFGLPAGKAFSCPGATSICESICYAGKLEKVYKGVREVLLHNWNLLKDATYPNMVALIGEMISEFRADCEKRGAEKYFRLHWDGDFFSDDYTLAWKDVILANPDIQFWAYTRVASSARILQGTPNLGLYFSADNENIAVAEQLRSEGIRLAYLADTFAEGQKKMISLTARPGAKCPENTRQLPLISEKGSACMACGLCPKGKADIVFSATKK